MTLAAWRSFPINMQPRPLILRGRATVRLPVLETASGGGRAAVGVYRLAAPLPSIPSSYARGSLVSAAEALAELQARAKPAAGSPAGRFVITSVRLATARYDTDRGVRVLPAWRFTVPGAIGNGVIVALPASRVFEGPAIRRLRRGDVDARSVDAQVSPDGRTITVGFFGSVSTDICTTRFVARALTSSRAVAIEVIDAAPPRPPGQLVACTLQFPLTRLTVHLDYPLGRRVLVSAQDAAVIPIVQKVGFTIRIAPPPSPPARETLGPTPIKHSLQSRRQHGG